MPSSDRNVHRPNSFTRRCRVIATGIALALLAVPAGPVGASRSCWLPPVSGRVVDEFRAPACRWCPGNRGLDYVVSGDSVVRAVATGVVTYSGTVAGTRYVVVDIGGGRLVTYGRLSSASVRRGDRVVARSRVGTVERTLFFGLRVHGTYADPSPYLGMLVGRPRLIPTDGSAPRPKPPAIVRCAVP